MEERGRSLVRNPHRGQRVSWTFFIGVLICPFFAAQIATAETMAPVSSAQNPGWTFEISPYFWAAGLKGNIGVSSRFPPASVDLDFNTIFENLDMAVMLAGEARRGRFGIIGEFNYLSLSADAQTPGPLYSGAELKNDVVFATMALAYRVYSDNRAAIDVAAGARFWDVKFELDFHPGLLAGQNAERSESWIDPIVGLRGSLNLGSGIFLSAMGDVGGFGVASDMSWQVMGLLGYQFNQSVTAVVGYRHLSVDYEKDGFVWDVELSGPLIGLTVRF
jgi:hypothetical protein